MRLLGFALVFATFFFQSTTLSAQFYGTVSFGEGKFSLDGASTTENSYSLWGGHSFNERFSLELGFMSVDKLVITDGIDSIGLDFSSLHIGGRINLTTDDTLNTYLRFGQAFWETDFSGTILNENIDDDEFYYGLGLSTSLSEYSSVDFSYLQFDAGTANFSNLSLGVHFYF